MNVTRKPPLLSGANSSVMETRRIVRSDERRMPPIGDIEEEHLILPTQHTQQAAERQRPPVVGEADVVRLVADRTASGQRDGTQDLAIGR